MTSSTSSPQEDFSAARQVRSAKPEFEGWWSRARHTGAGAPSGNRPSPATSTVTVHDGTKPSGAKYGAR